MARDCESYECLGGVSCAYLLIVCRNIHLAFKCDKCTRLEEGNKMPSGLSRTHSVILYFTSETDAQPK